MHHVSWEGIHLSKENIRAVEQFPMPTMYTEVRAFCGLARHHRHFIKGFTHIACPLYDVLGNEVKMGPVKLPMSAKHAVWELIQSTPVLVFPDFEKQFLLEMDASGEGLGAVLSQKQNDGHYHPVAFGSHALTPSEQNYHSSNSLLWNGASPNTSGNT